MCLCVCVRIVSFHIPESSFSFSSSSVDSTCLAALPTEALDTLALERSHQVATGATIETRQCQTLVDICGEANRVSSENLKGESVYSNKNTSLCDPMQKYEQIIHHLLLLFASLYDVIDGCTSSRSYTTRFLLPPLKYP